MFLKASAKRALYAILACYTCSALAQTNQSDPIVDLGYARYRGINNATTSTHEFYGIRFAQPPIGSLRWKAPLELDASDLEITSTEITNVTTMPPTCVQGYAFWTIPAPGTPLGSEDCLFLNIYQPANATNSSGLPVIVTIPGGGYITGGAGSGDPHALLRHSDNAFIFVALQYRLGAYGFLGSDAYAEEGGEPNIGLLDQRLGLEWIQRYIHLFGGDPAKVTVIGGSAGGGSITDQLILHGGESDPPFRGVIAEFPWWQQMLRQGQLDRQYHYLLDAANCSSLTCLKSLSEDALAVATQQTYVDGHSNGDYGQGHFYYGPYVDGDVIRDLPSRQFRNGQFTKVPMIIDHDMYEGYAFSSQNLTTVEEETQDLKTQFPYADDQFFEDVYSLYPREDFNSTFWQRQTWFGDFSINCPTYYVASAASSNDVPVYKMVFDAGSALHGATGPFLADPSTLPFPNPGYNVTLAEMMQDWWVSFALHLDPNAQSWSNVTKPTWPLYSESTAIISINYTEVGAVSDLYYDKNERCEFFEKNEDVVQN